MATDNNNTGGFDDLWDDNEAFLKASSLKELENPLEKKDSDNDQNDDQDDDKDSEEKKDVDPFKDLEENNDDESEENSDDESDDESEEESKSVIDQFFESTGIDKEVFQHVDFESIEDEEDLDINTILFDESEGRFEKYVENLASTLDDTGKEYFNYLKQGGNSTEFFNQFRQNSVDIDYENASPKEIIKEGLKMFEQDLDPEQIDDRIDYYEDKGLLDNKAESFRGKIKEYQETLSQRILEAQQEHFKQVREKEQEALNEVKEFIDNNTSIKDSVIQITPLDRKKLPLYIGNKVIPAGNGVKISQFQNDLNQALSSTEGLVAMAKVVQMISKGFDFSEIVNKVTTTNTDSKTKKNKKKKRVRSRNEIDFSNYL